jgi:peptide deformylase
LAILRVAQMGHPVLRLVSEPVDPRAIRSHAFQQFCDDLLETLAEVTGVGLAAPQVHMPIRVVIAEVDEEKGPEFFINPVITPLDDTTRRTWEGCLSVEGMRGLVVRPAHVRIQALDRDGSEKDLELEGFPAVVVQHECDHLDGVLYVDRIEPKTLMFLREWRRHAPVDDDAVDEDEDGDEDTE